jgi:hypothetical protein
MRAMTDELGPWTPLPVGDVGRLLRDAPLRWWFTGGVALELHVGTSWRAHEDVDVGIRRCDAAALYGHLSGLEVCVAAAGVLRPWHGEELAAQASENNLWVRSRDSALWILDVAVGEGDDTSWIYRRDPRIRRPWDEAVLATPDGLPYLAPELQLLFKSKAPRPKDDQDLREVLPLLEPVRRRSLLGLLPTSHPWRPVLLR